MVAGSAFLVIGYGNNYGSLTPNIYKGIKITSFRTLIMGSMTNIHFETINGIPETLKVKINSTVYDFTKNSTTDEDTGEVSISWKCNAKIFEKGKTYTIEFLN